VDGLDQVAPERERMKNEFLPTDAVCDDPNRRVADEDRIGTRVVYTGLFSPNASTADLSKKQLRYGLDTMFDIQWTLRGETVPPGVKQKQLKAEYLGISGNTVEDWMKDLQIDATARPDKAYDFSFEMPEPDVGIMTFNRRVAANQREQMGRPDILEKNCHSTCPKAMIETTIMYNPNMMVDILAIPPPKDPGDVCCRWRFSMRTEDDPAYVPVELIKNPRGNETRRSD
jgi:hypothetical protein